MFPQSLVNIAIAITIVAAAPNWGAASYAHDAEAEVVAVYDATESSGCVFEVQTNNGPVETQPCPQGTVIVAEPTSRTLAEQQTGAHILERSGNEHDDRIAIDQAASQLSRSLAMAKPAPAACPSWGRMINGSYDVGPVYGGNRVHFTLWYDLSSNCSVTNVRDRARADTALMTQWLRSCSNGQHSSCSGRSISLASTFTEYYPVPDGWYDSQYANVSWNRVGSTYYGFWYYS